MSKVDLKIDWATHEAARFACENWHYSGSMPSNKLVKIGAWENGSFVGVVIFSPGATPKLCMTYNLSNQQCCELSRVAMRSHQTEVSRVLSISMKFLVRANPNLRLIISFADTRQLHHGGIYQATNWIYVGKAGPTKLCYVNGSQVHERTMCAMVKQGKIKRSDVVWKPAMPKHKYLMPLDSEMRSQIEPLRKPYPKRAGSKDVVAPTNHVGGDGSTPIPALHSDSV